MMNRRQVLKACAAVGTYAAMRPAAEAAAVDPLTLPLVTSSTPLLTYLGSFNGPSDASFQYGGGALSVANSSPGVLGQLYASGLQQGNNNLGSMNIPAPTGTGGTYKGAETATTVVSGNTGVAFGALGGTGQTSITGSLAYGGKLYCTGAVDYDATGAQNAFMVVGNTNISGFGAPCHANGSSGTINRMFSNGMGLVPAIWQPILGGPAFVFGGPGGGAGLSINSQLACGYGFSTFNPASVVAGGAVALKEWINYPFSSAAYNSGGASVLSGYSTSSRSNWGANLSDNYIVAYDSPVGCAFIAPGSRTLLFLHWHAYGPVHTGAGTDPCNSNASGADDAPISPDTQAYKRCQLSAYDLAAVIAANPNGANALAPRPYAWWEVPNWQTIFGGACGLTVNREGQAWATYDIYNSLLYCSMGFGGTNGTISVFKVAGGGSAPTPPPPVPSPPTLKVS